MNNVPAEIYYSKESIELLHRIFDSVSPSTWHKIANPYCPQCLEQRGRELIENGFRARERGYED